MRKLSEIRDDEAMDALAEILDPVVNLAKNEKFKIAIRGDKKKNIKPNRLEAVKIAMTENRRDIVTIMAVLEGEKVEDFHYNMITLPKMILDLLNDKEMIDFFHYQAEKDSETSSGSATESTEGSQDTSSNM